MTPHRRRRGQEEPGEVLELSHGSRMRYTVVPSHFDETSLDKAKMRGMRSLCATVFKGEMVRAPKFEHSNRSYPAYCKDDQPFLGVRRRREVYAL